MAVGLPPSQEEGFIKCFRQGFTPVLSIDSRFSAGSCVCITSRIAQIPYIKNWSWKHLNTNITKMCCRSHEVIFQTYRRRGTVSWKPFFLPLHFCGCDIQGPGTSSLQVKMALRVLTEEGTEYFINKSSKRKMWQPFLTADHIQMQIYTRHFVTPSFLKVGSCDSFTPHHSLATPANAVLCRNFMNIVFILPKNCHGNAAGHRTRTQQIKRKENCRANPKGKTNDGKLCKH